MKQKLIGDIMLSMLPYLNNAQTAQLRRALETRLCGVEITESPRELAAAEDGNDRLVDAFISAKNVEGCSEKSLRYYRATIKAMLQTVGKRIQEIETDDLRRYLTAYQEKRNSCRVTIDNIRRILSSFFSWLEDEDYILKSPVRRIHKVTTSAMVKETYTD